VKRSLRGCSKKSSGRGQIWEVLPRPKRHQPLPKIQRLNYKVRNAPDKAGQHGEPEVLKQIPSASGHNQEDKKVTQRTQKSRSKADFEWRWSACPPVQLPNRLPSPINSTGNSDRGGPGRLFKTTRVASVTGGCVMGLRSALRGAVLNHSDGGDKPRRSGDLGGQSG
jgi:hypothetical protein